MWANEFNSKMKPITEAQKKYHKQHSARYIFVYDKDGNARCSSCDAEFNLGHTKHLSNIECPQCKRELKVQHTWRMKHNLEVIRFMVIPKVLTNTKMVLRYVLAYAKGDEPIKVSEVAREYLDEYHAEPEFYTWRSDCYYDRELKTMIYDPCSWKKGRGLYFRTDSYMCPNRFWCRECYEYPRNFFKEINKLDCFKYYPAETEYCFQSYPSQLLYMMRSARLNEKLIKAGMEKLASNHRYYFTTHNDRCYSQNYKATSLIKMLKLDNERYGIFKEHPTTEMLFFLQKPGKKFKISDFKLVDCNVSAYKSTEEYANKIGVSFPKMHKYLKGIKNHHEYSHYLWVLEKLGYDLKDTYYSMPKDFWKADKKASDEYAKIQEEERIKQDNKRIKELESKNALIKEISDGFKRMDGLQEFLNGSNGLLIYVPDSVTDLIEEGRKLHNCIGSYVDRVANGNTFVFFVRKLDAPYAPFVAFEYFNGEVVQCRYDHNETVDDDNIIQFVNRFADCLRKATA